MYCGRGTNEVGWKMVQTAKFFGEQVSDSAYLIDLFYIIPTMGTFLAVFALALIDCGLVNAKHLIDTFAQKLISAFVCGGCFMLVGYAIWMWQFNQAFAVPNGFQQSISDWWLFGRYMRTYAQNIDPKVLAGAETQQIFVAFFFAYAGMLGAFIHSMGVARMRPAATYILSAFTGGVVMPFLAYLTWGPVGPLTNSGLHDFVGACSVYTFVGTWSLIIAWRLGPRIASSNSFNPPLFVLGAMLLMLAIPIFVLGCGFLVPGTGYFGIDNTTTGIGIILCNVFMAYTGGALSGAAIAYLKRKPVFAFFGPIAGYVVCTSFFDIALPWQCLLISTIGPWILLGLKELMTAINIDDQKLVPLALGPAIFSMLVAGIIGAGRPTGGYSGATGAYAFQHAHISFGMQCLGILVTLAFSAVSGLVLVLAIEKTIGLRVPRTIEQDGLDMWYWNEWRKSRKMRVSPRSLPDYQMPDPAQTGFR
jgi:ammonium transporter, Amt family